MACLPGQRTIGVPAASQGALFDFYISPTGSDSNAGTVAAPWAITSLISTNSNNSKMVSKRVGFLPGTYNVCGTALAGSTLIAHGTQPNNGSFCALSVPPGTAQASTYIGTSDASGHYSPRTATIVLNCGQNGVTTDNKWNNAIIGRDQTSTVGYVTIDGLVINGNGANGGMDCVGPNGNEGAHIIFFQSTDGSFTAAGSMAGILVQNCDVGGIQATDSGGNDACIWFQGCTGAIAQYNYVHDVNKANDPSHAHGLEAYGCTGGQWNYNTFANCTGGAAEPKEGCGGIECAYNYIYNCGTSTVGNSAVFQAWDGAQGNPNSPNNAMSLHHNILDSCGRAKRGESNNDQNFMALDVYNNTVYDARSGSTNGGWILVTNGAVGAILKHYNNIYVASQNGGDSGSGQGTSAGKTCVTANAMAVLDYNDYYSLNASYTAMWGVGNTSYSTLANWRTNSGGDANGATADPQFVPGTGNIVAGGGPSQFKLGAGSALIGAGRVGGTSGGAAINVGAWDGVVTRIGCGFGPYA